MLSQLGMGSNIGWLASPSRGLSGGLLTIWSADHISVSSHTISQNWILIQGINKINDCSFACINIYAPQTATQKLHLWREIESVISRLGELCLCILGDFNVVRSSSEKQDCLFNGNTARDFNSFISTNSLLDIPILNSFFTWIGLGLKRGQLDRALVSTSWYGDGNWILQALDRKLSDHKPLVLKSKNNDWGPRPFKFFNCWLDNQDLAQQLKSAWSQTNSTNPQHKFRTLRHVARQWNEKKLGNIDTQIKLAEKSQEENDQARSGNPVTTFKTAELRELYRNKASMLWQKSRARWNLHGERNSRFFHKIMVRRRSYNGIKKLHLGEDVFYKPIQIKMILKKHFQSLLQEPQIDKVFSIGSLLQTKLDSDQSKELEREFSLQEIESALRSTDKTKAPGPDRINAGVLTMLWPEIKNDVLKFFKDFHHSGILPKGSNSSFIALIPKRPNASHPSDFRPISLMNALTKLLTKVMATRLKALMPDLVSEHQSAFIKGRQVTDGILITSEIVSMLQQNKLHDIIFKIDFEKAFDRVKWTFVYDVLRAMNFGSTWIAWIQKFFASSYISVLVNGSPTTEFQPSRGLRQGDPLSPLLFNLVGEALSCMIKTGARENLFRGITLKEGSVQMTHLQFADDVILFLNDDYSSILGIKRILQCFQVISGMKVNFTKSQVYAFHIDAEVKKKWALKLQCILGSVPFKYLGANIGASPSSIQFWEPLIERFKRKVSCYDASHISMAGRAVLLQAAIDSTPVYWLSLYKIPVAVVKSIESIGEKA